MFVFVHFWQLKINKNSDFQGFLHFTAQWFKIREILLGTLYVVQKNFYNIAALSSVYYRAKGSKSISSNEKYVPFFRIIMLNNTKYEKNRRKTFVHGEILYLYLWLDL